MYLLLLIIKLCYQGLYKMRDGGQVWSY